MDVCYIILLQRTVLSPDTSCKMTVSNIKTGVLLEFNIKVPKQKLLNGSQANNDIY